MPPEILVTQIGRLLFMAAPAMAELKRAGIGAARPRCTAVRARSDPPPRRVPVVLLAGFLGAGKVGSVFYLLLISSARG
jgi:hypothetical protein